MKPKQIARNFKSRIHRIARSRNALHMLCLFSLLLAVGATTGPISVTTPSSVLSTIVPFNTVMEVL